MPLLFHTDEDRRLYSEAKKDMLDVLKGIDPSHRTDLSSYGISYTYKGTKLLVGGSIGEDGSFHSVSLFDSEGGSSRTLVVSRHRVSVASKYVVETSLGEYPSGRDDLVRFVASLSHHFEHMVYVVCTAYADVLVIWNDRINKR